MVVYYGRASRRTVDCYTVEPLNARKRKDFPRFTFGFHDRYCVDSGEHFPRTSQTVFRTYSYYYFQCYITNHKVIALFRPKKLNVIFGSKTSLAHVGWARSMKFGGTLRARTGAVTWGLNAHVHQCSTRCGLCNPVRWALQNETTGFFCVFLGPQNSGF